MVSRRFALFCNLLLVAAAVVAVDAADDELGRAFVQPAGDHQHPSEFDSLFDIPLRDIRKWRRTCTDFEQS
jgi:hypothetical protein